MKLGVYIKNGVSIPVHELHITASRAGGPGGQHVNKASTRITVRWNIQHTQALTYEQKERVLKNLQSEMTTSGDIIIHSSASRSQQQNKKNAFDILSTKIRKALYVPKKRIKTTVSESTKKKRLEKKKRQSLIKKMRSKKIEE